MELIILLQHLKEPQGIINYSLFYHFIIFLPPKAGEKSKLPSYNLQIPTLE
jgi:hypothetical protein